MGLEFYNIETRECLYHISDTSIAAFEIMFESFNEKYNDLIDMYGDFRLYANHLIFLKEFVKYQRSEQIVEFMNLIDKCLIENITLFVKGD